MHRVEASNSDALLSIDEAAQRIGVSRSTLAEVVRRSPPFPVRRDGRRWLIPQPGLMTVLAGEAASPLVQDALECARTDAGGVTLLGASVEELQCAVREASSGLRLARSAQSPEQGVWINAHRLLVDACTQVYRTRLPEPADRDFDWLATWAEGEVDSWLEAASFVQARRKSWPPGEIRDHTAIGLGSVAMAIRMYADARRRWGTHVIDRVLLGDVQDTVEIELVGDWNAAVGDWSPEFLERLARALRTYASPLLPPIQHARAQAAALDVADWLTASATAITARRGAS